MFQEPREPWCNLPYDGGDCEAEFPAWYFNKQTGACEEFSYGGCGGNKNNFETPEECVKDRVPFKKLRF